MGRLQQFELIVMRGGDFIRARIASAIKSLWQRPAIRWRVVLLSLLIPLLCANVAFIWQDYNLRRNAIVEQHDQESGQIIDQLDDFLHTTEGVTHGFAVRWVKRHQATPTDPEILNAQVSDLTDFINSRPEFSHGFITDATGTIRISSDPALTGERLGSADLYQQAYTIKRFIVSDAFVPSGDQDPFVLFIQPLRWNTSRPEGFLVLQTKLLTISEILDLSTYLPPDARVTILDSQGKVLGRIHQRLMIPVCLLL
jgi:hypothetical protein